MPRIRPQIPTGFFDLPMIIFPDIVSFYSNVNPKKSSVDVFEGNGSRRQKNYSRGNHYSQCKNGVSEVFSLLASLHINNERNLGGFFAFQKQVYLFTCTGHTGN